MFSQSLVGDQNKMSYLDYFYIFKNTCSMHQLLLLLCFSKNILQKQAPLGIKRYIKLSETLIEHVFYIKL